MPCDYEMGEIVKGNDQIIATLNGLLANELTAINQYMVHAEMCDNWGYDKLHISVEKRAIEEMKHAEMLIARIIFLEGVPIVSQLREIHIGSHVEAQFRNDHAAEIACVGAYNSGIQVAREVGDNVSREMLETILKAEEEEHVDWLEAQLDQIKQMGIDNYLTEQTA